MDSTPTLPTPVKKTQFSNKVHLPVQFEGTCGRQHTPPLPKQITKTQTSIKKKFKITYLYSWEECMADSNPYPPNTCHKDTNLQ